MPFSFLPEPGLEAAVELTPIWRSAIKPPANLFLFVIAGVRAPKAPHWPFFCNNGASPQMTCSKRLYKSQGHADNLGSNPRAWLGTHIKLTRIISWGFCGSFAASKLCGFWHFWMSLRPSSPSVVHQYQRP